MKCLLHSFVFFSILESSLLHDFLSTKWGEPKLITTKWRNQPTSLQDPETPKKKGACSRFLLIRLDQVFLLLLSWEGVAGQPKKQNNSRNRTLGYFRDFQKEPMSLTRCFLTLSQGFFGTPKGGIYSTPFCRHPNFYSHCLVLASQIPKEQQALLIKLGYLRVVSSQKLFKIELFEKGPW